ncbi:MFS sugar transporter-like protein [Tothia fuscella]|uniref:MFS sugar transporter-like protein n=1 Tax=Tothia fuscella TaxID=1048955 RepID=A0A9P4TYJ4_9PEZI|nr:MFS sugar transporter-like protein [Tothia fuscella]
MAIIDNFIPPGDRRAALLLYGLIFAISFNGYDSGIMTVILADKQFIKYYNVDSTRSGTIAVIPWASQGIAQLFVGGTLASLMGRLWLLRAAILLISLGVVVQCVPNTYAVLLLGRLMTGMGTGCTFIATSLYVAECSPAKLRGSFVGTVTQFGYQLGTLIAFWTGYGMSFHKAPFQIAWRVSNLIQIPIGLTFVAISFWYPESPRWLLEKYPDQPQRALKQLAYIRDGSPEDENIRQEFHEMVASYEFRRKFEPGFRGIFKTPALRKRLAYGLYATALQQFGGIAALTMYAALIYESLGWNKPNQALAINGVQAVLQLFVVLVNTFTVDRFGRRTLLITGFAIQALALLIISCLTTSFPDNKNKAAAVVEVAMLFIVGLTYCWSNGPVSVTFASEIFPAHVREKAYSISLMGQTLCLIALTQPWPKFNKQVGGKSYWLLFSLNVVAMISVIFILPETKGVSLERMDKLFGEIDYVDAREAEIGTEAKESTAYSTTMSEGGALRSTKKEMNHTIQVEEEIKGAKV